MRHLLIALFVVLTVVGSASAQEAWHFQVDFMPRMTVSGNDVHVGDIVSQKTTVRLTGNSERVDYSFEYEPLITKLGKDKTLLFSGGYRRGIWGVSAYSWNAGSRGSLGDRISSPPPTLSFTANSFVLSAEQRAVRMWDHTLTPVDNEREDSGISMVNYHAENSLSMRKTDVVGEALALDNPDFKLRIQGGLAFGRVNNLRSEGQTQEAHLSLPEKLLEEFLPTLSPDTAVPLTFDNFITLESRSSASADLKGPVAAVVLEFAYKRLQFSSRVSQSFLSGSAKPEGLWTDVDDIRETILFNGQRIHTTTFFNGFSKMPLKEIEVSIPVLDVGLSTSYVVIRSPQTISVGATFFASNWFGVPLAPSWSVPGEWRGDGGSGWKQNQQNIGLHGFSFFAKVGF